MQKLYTIFCHDKPNAEQIRKVKLAEHLAYIESVMSEIAVAGPLYDEAEKVVGSLLVVKADTVAAARTFLEQDPFYQAGIYERIDMNHLSRAAGEWVGGKAW